MAKIRHELAKDYKIRNCEYYDQQPVLDKLFKDSEEGKKFKNLYSLIISENNILMAYRNIKSNASSILKGSDNLNIKDIEKLTTQEVCEEIRRRLSNYQPKSVKKIEIPRDNDKIRPLGIPSIWDRLIQQCILQILEPICEARFSDNSYGFRPLRGCHNAIARVYSLAQKSNLHYVVMININCFFDNVNHKILMNQLWNLGIQDSKVRAIIRKTLHSPIKLSSGVIKQPVKGVLQSGILSPLLSNIVLNEFDRHIEYQWENSPIIQNYQTQVNYNGSLNKGNAYRAMRKTNLKEMYIVRYADDIVIFCRNKQDADKVMYSSKKWLSSRLKLSTSDIKTKVINLEKQYMNFLGLNIKLHKSRGKYVVISHISKYNQAMIHTKLKKILIDIKHSSGNERIKNINKYNSTIRGIHEYFKVATMVSFDVNDIAYKLKWVTKKSLKHEITKYGKMNIDNNDYQKYGKSKQIRYIGRQYLLPLSYVKTTPPMCLPYKISKYTKDGREKCYNALNSNVFNLIRQINRTKDNGRSIEFNDNKLALMAAQNGRCAITNIEFLSPNEIHCHHIVPIKMGGNDNYQNLILVLEDVHRLIHATKKETIQKYFNNLQSILNEKQFQKLNNLRNLAGNPNIQKTDIY